MQTTPSRLRLLQWAAAAWWVPVFMGQLFLADHIARTYLVTAARGDLAAWNGSLFVGIVPGDSVGNAALIAHIFIAFAITLSGLLQLIPWLRRGYPVVHRWNGRLFIMMTQLTAAASLWMIWTRNTFGGILANDLASSLNAVSMMVFAVLALRAALRREFARHQQWALRTFLVVNGVWFKRVIYALAQQLPFEIPGLAADMTGPTDVIFNLASFLVPLAGLELYSWAKRAKHPVGVQAATCGIAVATILTAIGSFGVVFRWLAGR